VSTPAYMEIVVFLRERILTGEYPDGKIPGTSVLARRFHTSYSTVSHARAQLEEDGLIARDPHRPPLIAARAEPCGDGEYIAAISRDGRKMFCRKCWAHVHFVGPGTGHVCR
jgi:DNA-binding transcriptional regulator YhcF (GntR family)